MYVSCFSSNTRVNRVVLTVTSPHMSLVRVLHQLESDAADARSLARHPRTSSAHPPLDRAQANGSVPGNFCFTLSA